MLFNISEAFHVSEAVLHSVVFEMFMKCLCCVKKMVHFWRQLKHIQTRFIHDSAVWTGSRASIRLSHPTILSEVIQCGIALKTVE